MCFFARETLDMECHRGRAVRWMSALVGSSRCVARARLVDVRKLAESARDDDALENHVTQIKLDVSRTQLTSLDKAQLQTTLCAWLALNNSVGYTQGMHMIGAVLQTVYKGRTRSLDNDVLASLASAANINAAYMPMHMADVVPLSASHSLAVQIWIDLSCSAPIVGEKTYPMISMIRMFVLRSFPVLFANAVQSEMALCEFWDFIFEHGATDRSRACRHLLVAMMLAHSRLFQFGVDPQQSFSIFEGLLSILQPKSALEIVRSAAHLSRVETISGASI